MGTENPALSTVISDLRAPNSPGGGRGRCSVRQQGTGQAAPGCFVSTRLLAFNWLPLIVCQGGLPYSYDYGSRAMRPAVTICDQLQSLTMGRPPIVVCMANRLAK
jgi:hypothetical protein